MPEYKKDMKLLASIPRRAGNMVKGLEGMEYKKQLGSLGLLSPEQRILKGALIDTNNFHKRNRTTGVDLSSKSDRTQGNGTELHQGSVRFGIRKQFFSEREVGHWNTLHMSVAIAPSLPETG